MELAIGTETRREYLSFELAAAAKKMVEEVFPIKADENVVVTADTGSDSRVVDATAQALFALGAHPVVIWYEMLPNPCTDPPAPVGAALAAADAWIEYAIAYALYSPAHAKAMESGCRYFCLPGMDVDMMVRTIGKPNYTALNQMRDKLYELSQAATEMHMTSPAGTDLVARVDKAGFRARTRKPGQGFSQMLGGQATFASILDSIHGTLVFDGALWPPAELGALRSPIEMKVEDGFITEVRGGAEAKVFERWLASFNNEAMYRVAHCSYGFNPGVTRITGRIVEDERVFGCMEFGVGPTRLGAPTHTDGLVLNPSVWADDVQLEDEGVYVHPELARLCREMEVPGY